MAVETLHQVCYTATPFPENEVTVALRILFLGEIVGKAGVFCVKSMLKGVCSDHDIDFVIANGDGATGGFGIGKNHSIYLHKLGINVLTGGECIFYKKDMVDHIRKAPYVLRAANYPAGTPGRGWRVYSVRPNDESAPRIGVISLMGQSGYNRVHPSNPFTYLPELVDRMREQTSTIVLDFHATTTAEKYTMFHHADGMVSAVIGTHTKALSADERIMPKGTAVLCDAGRTGSLVSVGGLEPSIEIQKFLTQIPERSKDAWDAIEMQGAVIDVADDGRATSIQRLRLPCAEEPHDRNGSGDGNTRQNRPAQLRTAPGM